jgi:hypothetical protein
MNKKNNINLMSKWDYNIGNLIYYKNKYKKHHGIFTNIIITYLDL